MAESGDRDEKHSTPPPPPPPPSYKSIYPEMPEKVSDKLAKINGKLEISRAFTNDISLIIKAADLAARRHRQQRRKDAMQTPYVNHPIVYYDTCSSDPPYLLIGPSLLSFSKDFEEIILSALYMGLGILRDRIEKLGTVILFFLLVLDPSKVLRVV
ncbi:hypothetical protein WUBG_13330 [Wuchereria bancrofti]|uniref:Uncharacterized protein n=1 Tax=Wuchereria bancrofti TaxID=6293 RepID=J9AN96_WUCBA|nr:hypothetical protein WUBG_13330 [Wuchereria bancrofti]